MDERARSWRVEFYVDRRGRSPALEYLRSLAKHEQAEALRVIDLLEEFGVGAGSSSCMGIASGALPHRGAKLMWRYGVGLSSWHRRMNGERKNHPL